MSAKSDVQKQQDDVKAAAKEFDVAAFLAGVKPARWSARVPTRADLVPRITELYEELKDDPGETDEAVGDPGRAAKVAAYNKLVNEFEASHQEFVFRPNTGADRRAALEAMRADGLDPAEVLEDDALQYFWAQTCVEPAGMTPAAFAELRALLGDAALFDLNAKWLAANTNPEVHSAPLSQRPSPGRTTQK